ncbi:MAG TPA: hypothetical protein PLX71_06790, partial [Phycicoccus sp.]|nr:hypothetical protein [Phycicoccus sp.]
MIHITRRLYAVSDAAQRGLGQPVGSQVEIGSTSTGRGTEAATVTNTTTKLTVIATPKAIDHRSPQPRRRPTNHSRR